MAKRKIKIVDLDVGGGEVVIEPPKEVEIIDLPGSQTKTIVKKVKPETKTIVKKVKPEIKTVLGSDKAEALQKKGGWILISAVKVDVDVGGLTVKEYKFRKEQ